MPTIARPNSASDEGSGTDADAIDAVKVPLVSPSVGTRNENVDCSWAAEILAYRRASG